MSDQSPDYTTSDGAFSDRLLGSGDTTESTSVYVAPASSATAVWAAEVWQRTLPLERLLFGEKLEPRKELQKSIRRGNTSKLLALVKSGVDVDAEFEGEVPLPLACRLGNAEAVLVLLEVGVKLDTVDSRGRTALHWAAEAGDLRLVGALVDAGTDLDARDEDGYTALQLAESNGSSAAIDMLKGEKRIMVHKPAWVASLVGVRSSWETVAPTPPGASPCGSHSPNVLSREVSNADCDHPSAQNSFTFTPRLNPVNRLSVDEMFANKYRIDSRFASRNGLSRTAVEVATGKRVTLDFYTDPEELDKSLQLYGRLNASKGVCRLVEEVDAHDGLPECLVVQRGQYTLAGWIKTPGISLQSKLQALDSIAEALEELHGLGMVHGDLNPANLTFFPAEQRWKLLNFDSASTADLKREPATTDIGYAAPESLQGQVRASEESKCHSAVDMWSFGLIAFEVFTRKKFYEADSLSRKNILSFVNTRSFGRRLNAIEDWSQRHFVKKFVKLDPSSRCAASEARGSSLLRRINAKN